MIENRENQPKVVRAAIYTRVSTDEGLDQEFNSLDAQYEACQAYIRSQRHEGWRQVRERYDDGGFSGGSMKRPALDRLLDDVRAGAIDTIVVYKIDRLTRSLADFSRIVDVLDGHKASFISITQAFSTTTSMGRLTLNVLLSFAQFEREVGAERVRDKIASSKKKGMWMGGVVPLGYDVRARKLVINQKEAQRVRHIFERYLELKSVVLLEQELEKEGILSKRYIGKSGKTHGGKSFGRGALYNLLSNVIYVGKIAHKGEAYDGLHRALLDEALFNQAQAVLAKNRSRQRHGQDARQPSLLAGLLIDERGVRISPSHTTRGSRRFRYYVAREPGANGAQRFRAPAAELEKIVIDRLCQWLEDGHRVEKAFQQARPDAATLEALLFTASSVLGELKRAAADRKRELLLGLIEHVVIGVGQLRIRVRPAALFAFAELEQPPVQIEMVTLSTPCNLIRRSREVRLAVSPRAGAEGSVDPSLVKLLVKAHAARAALFAGQGASIAEVAMREGHEPHYFSVLVKLSYLAPDITEAVLNGRQPLGLDRQRLARMRQLPFDWEGQRRRLGFAAY